MTLSGRPIEIHYRAGLRDTAGNAAHAATFIRQRLIVFDTQLRRNRSEYRRILLHELFHFVWVRFGNDKRRAWEDVLRSEWSAGASGEAGWSAEWRKGALTAGDVRRRSRKWREYCCESFCDTAACVYSASRTEVTLSPRRLADRQTWFAGQLTGSLPI